MVKSGEMEKLCHRWFAAPIPPKNIVIDYPMNAQTKDALANPSSEGI
jgi:glutamate/aspartate transport system substrate-binding protein